MYQSVREAWLRFSTPLEGDRIPYLYADIAGDLTTGVGQLVDPVSLALPLPWRMSDGSLAPKDEVSRQWHAVKAQAEFLKKRHHRYAADVSTMRLSEEDIEALVERKLDENHAYMRKWFPALDDVPADAQMAIHSLAWAAGPGFNQKFPNWTRQALAGKWSDCAISGQLRMTLKDGTPNYGVAPRNRANKLCFENAAFVAKHGLDPSVLHWPNRAPDTIVMPPEPEDDPPMSLPLVGDPHALLQARLNEGLEFGGARNLDDEPGFLPSEAPTKSDPPKQA